ncbi:hypothetical protein I4U23_020392 [Adineta vaga]|nr:hypothetical protein I4U23_020392 [Adineta vaga]
MAWPKLCTSIRRSKALRFLLISGTILLIFGVITAIVIVTSGSKSTTHSSMNNTQTSMISPFNITYILRDSLNNNSPNELTFSSDEREQITRSFETNLNLSVQNVLQIRNIISTTAMGNTSSSRRKRLVQCDQDVSGMSGPALAFDFNVLYPSNLSCQNQTCINQILMEIYRRFRTVRSFAIDIKNRRQNLRLCSVGSLPSTPDELVEEVGTTLTTTANTTTTQTFSSVESTVITLSFPTTQTSATTPISNTQTIVFSTTNPNVTSNETLRDVEVCIRKLPLIQEQTSPYGFSLTSTLFYQDEHILVVVGASKFETILNMQTKQRGIVINGIMVYNKCQRTLDVTLPMNI